MSITLLCPNGHKLVCPEQQAGKRGKCPHCGATFRVPELPGTPASSGSGPLSGVKAAQPIPLAPHVTPRTPLNMTPPPQPAEELQPKPAEPAPTAATAPTATPAPVVPAAPANPIRPYEEGPYDENDAIAFLCPNGHHLCGPTSLGGKPGECPICGIKFLIPSEEDLTGEAEEVAHAAESSPTPEGRHEASGNGATPDRRSLVDLFESFWAYKEPGVTIELHLDNGKVVAPDGYAPHLSRQGHGVFMVRETNGSYTLAAIIWSSIAQVSVRGVKELPEGVFD
jgi:hypothetical protein